MLSTQTQKNNFVNMVAPAPQPVFVPVVPAPMPLFALPPVMQPLADIPLPILQPTLTPIFNVSSDTSILFYDGNAVSAVPSHLTPTIHQGILQAPEGYSFATMNCSTLPTQAQNVESTGNVNTLVDSPEPTPEPVITPAQTKARKFKHGSKQERIMEVYEAIQRKYTEQGVYAGEHEVLRGADTVRVHVKTYKGLNKIEAALQEVDDCPDVRLRKLATPFSMKNRFQKKGFIVYLRLEHADMVDSVKAVFKKYEEFFRKCDVAMPKPTDPVAPIIADNKISDFLDKENAPFFHLPLPMVKQTSAPSDAA